MLYYAEIQIVTRVRTPTDFVRTGVRIFFVTNNNKQLRQGIASREVIRHTLHFHVLPVSIFRMMTSSNGTFSASPSLCAVTGHR